MPQADVIGFCPACSSPVTEWTPGPGGRPRASCPNCGSLERHRHLAVVLTGLRPLLITNAAVLEAAPYPRTKATIRAVAPDVPYVTTDFIDLRWTDVQADGCSLPFRDSSFGLVLHFHTFEHIPDDRSAMREIARVLMPGGIMLSQVPRREGRPTDEDFSLGPEERLARFGQSDHVRMYGDDFEDRLRECGFTVSSSSAADILEASKLEWYNIGPSDRIWSCRPSTHGAPRHAAQPATNGSNTNEHEAEVDTLRTALAAAKADADRLKSRRVVRAGLRAVRPFRPAFTALRRIGLLRNEPPGD